MQEVLQFKIVVDQIYEVKSSAGIATMILFHGDADCENFRGKVLPGGVDTQVEYKGKKRSLSARYILEGVDAKGCTCRIFVENQGLVEPHTDIIKTKPTIITDSAVLKWLESASLTGSVREKDGYIIIQIFEE